jgi:hypothetical protein
LYVAICSDDLWVGVKCQSNPEIAGSPRKVFRDRALQKSIRGKATGWNSESFSSYFNQTQNTGIQCRVDSHTGLSLCDERETTQTLS